MRYKYYVALWDTQRGHPRYRYFRIGIHRKYYRWSELMTSTNNWTLTNWYLGAAQQDIRFKEIKSVTEEQLNNIRIMQELVA